MSFSHPQTQAWNSFQSSYRAWTNLLTPDCQALVHEPILFNLWRNAMTLKMFGMQQVPLITFCKVGLKPAERLLFETSVFCKIIWETLYRGLNVVLKSVDFYLFIYIFSCGEQKVISAAQAVCWCDLHKVSELEVKNSFVFVVSLCDSDIHLAGGNGRKLKTTMCSGFLMF